METNPTPATNLNDRCQQLIREGYSQAAAFQQALREAYKRHENAKAKN